MTASAQAVAGPAAVDHMQRLDGIVRSVASQLKAKPDDIPARVSGAGAYGPCHTQALNVLVTSSYHSFSAELQSCVIV